MKKVISQWGIYVVDLGEPYGSVQGGIRLAVILQNNIGNQFSPTTICLPMTTQHKKDLPIHYKLFKKDYPFLENSTVLCEQVMTVDIDKQVKQRVGFIRNEDKKELYNVFSKNFNL